MPQSINELSGASMESHLFSKVLSMTTLLGTIWARLSGLSVKFFYI